jgi:hypothetical protein
MHSKLSSEWLPSYIKAKEPVLEIPKMAGYFPDSPRTESGIGSFSRNSVFSCQHHDANVSLFSQSTCFFYQKAGDKIWGRIESQCYFTNRRNLDKNKYFYFLSSLKHFHDVST